MAITEKAKDYTIEIKYPAVKLNKDVKGEKLINEQIRSVIESDKTRFLKERAKPFNDFNNGLATDYKVVGATAELLSLRFNSLVYYAGAAHPQHWLETLNFDLRTGRQLTLADLFGKKPKYLSVISRFCVKELLGRKELTLDGDWVKRGAGPETKNFQCFNVTDKELIITFPEYQVAPYAVGELEVTIRKAAVGL